MLLCLRRGKTQKRQAIDHRLKEEAQRRLELEKRLKQEETRVIQYQTEMETKWQAESGRLV